MLPIGARPVRGTAWAASPLLLLASCTFPLYAGRDNYAEGMRLLQYQPGAATSYFAAGDQELAQAITEDELEPPDLVLAVTLRVRCLIELDRHGDVPGVLATDIKEFDPERHWRGDPVGLSLLRASRLDPERAYAELLLAERLSGTLRARQHVAWEQVHLLQKLGTPQAKSEAVKICDAYSGKIDFDALKRSLMTP